MYYADDDAVTVVSPALGARYQSEGVRASAQLAVDMVTAASVDLVSAASPRGYEETRKEATLGAGLEAARGVWFDASHAVSVEPDSVTRTFGISHAHDVLDRRVTLSLDYGLGLTRFGRAGEPSLDRSRTQHGVTGGASMVLRPTLVLDTVFGVEFVSGAQENPYRFVRLYRGEAMRHATAVPEAVPGERRRQTATLRLRARPFASTFGQAAYRLYTDTWGLTGHTALVRLARGFFTDRLVLTAELRGHHQGAASFHRARYLVAVESDGPLEVPRYRTADKELGGLHTLRAGAHAEISLPVRAAEAFRLGFGFDLLHIRYRDFEPLDARTARIYTVDLTYEP